MLLIESLHKSVMGWRTNPFRMVAQLVTSTIVGQAIFWRFGYDQLGIAMNPKREYGVGITIADKAAARLPQTATVAWIVKLLEIISDIGKIPVEGRAYLRHGIVPDVVACAVTQPLWSGIEAAEKTIGVITHPERVNTPEQVRVSVACIYGSLFRYGLGFAVILMGERLNRWITLPIERLLRLPFKK